MPNWQNFAESGHTEIRWCPKTKKKRKKFKEKTIFGILSKNIWIFFTWWRRVFKIFTFLRKLTKFENSIKNLLHFWREIFLHFDRNFIQWNLNKVSSKLWCVKSVKTIWPILKNISNKIIVWGTAVSGFVGTFHPAAPGLNPKHTVYTLLI